MPTLRHNLTGVARGISRDRLLIVLKTLGALTAAAGIIFAINATARVPRPRPMAFTHTVSLAEFGLQVTLASTWKLEPGQEGTEFVANDTQTGAILAGAVTLNAPPVPRLDSVIDKLIEEQRSRLGVVENMSRGAIGVGLLDGQWVKLSFTRQGDPVRMKALAVQQGPRTLTLICTGGTPAQKACDAAIRSVTMAR